jgi:hypothetical protein
MWLLVHLVQEQLVQYGAAASVLSMILESVS